MAFKPVSILLRDVIVRALLWVAKTEDKYDEELLNRLLHCPCFRILAFTIDIFCSIKLPLEVNAPQREEPSQPGNTPTAPR